jgi:hypothetical protein
MTLSLILYSKKETFKEVDVFRGPSGERVGKHMLSNVIQK